MITSVNFMSRWSAMALHPQPAMAMISILDEAYPDFTLPVWADERICYLRFHDLENDPEKMARADALGKRYIYFDEALAAKIMAFTNTLHGDSRGIDLRIHCEAGVSRSSAVAYWVATHYGIDLPSDYTLRASPRELVLKELFSLSRGEPVDVVKKLIPSSVDCAPDDIIFGSQSYTCEIAIVPRR